MQGACTSHQRDYSSDFEHMTCILYVLPSSLDARGCPRHNGSPPLAQYCAMCMHCVAFSCCCLLCRCRLFFGGNPPRSLNVGQPNVHGNEHDHPLDAEQHPPPGRHPPEPRQPFLKVHLCQTVFVSCLSYIHVGRVESGAVSTLSRAQSARCGEYIS